MKHLKKFNESFLSNLFSKKTREVVPNPIEQEVPDRVWNETPNNLKDMLIDLHMNGFQHRDIKSFVEKCAEYFKSKDDNGIDYVSEPSDVTKSNVLERIALSMPSLPSSIFILELKKLGITVSI